MNRFFRLLLALIILIALLSLDLIIIPLLLKTVIGWLGVTLSYSQCLIVVILWNCLTYGFRKSK